MKKRLYNPTYFRDGQLTYRSKGVRHTSLKTYEMKDGVLLGIFQGSYGDRPDVDFIIKFLEPGPKRRLRTPTNLHWVVDLLLKAESHRQTVSALVDYFIDFYSRAKPFDTPEERADYLPTTAREVLKKFPTLNHSGTYSLEYICYLIELFSICEKATPRKTKMFRSLLECLQKYFRGARDFYQVLNAAAPGYR